MTGIGDDALRRKAFERLRRAVADLDGASASGHFSAAEHAHLLEEFREAVRLADDLLMVLEHQVRGPLTVVKGRAQMLRRQQLAAPQPDLRLIAGLNEIDGAVDRIVAQLNRLLNPPPGSPDAPTKTDIDAP